MDSKRKQSKVNLSNTSSAEEVSKDDQPIADDIQELLDGYLGVPPDIQDLITDYLQIKERRKQKGKRKNK